jgi:hypothetical protein
MVKHNAIAKPKKLLVVIVLVIGTLIFTSNFNHTYAQRAGRGEGQPWGSDCNAFFMNPGDPSPWSIVCPLAKILNFMILAGVTAFIIMFVYGMYKYASATGDPKGTAAAQQTVTYAVIGLLVIIGMFTVLLVIGNLFDLDVLNFLTGDAIIDNIYNEITHWMEVLGIEKP